MQLALAGYSRSMSPAVTAQPLVLELPAAPSSVAEARHALDAFARECDVVDRFSVRAAVSEAVGNAIAHAYPDRRSGSVRLEAECGERQIFVAVEDSGTGLQASPNRGLGFGLKLMRKLADEMVVEDRQGRGLRIELRFARRAGASV